MTRLRAVLVEDEPPAMDRLRRLLEAHADVLEVVGTAADVPEGVATVATHQPNVLFLDIEMPGGGGFDLLHALEQPPHVVFVTAYASYAVRAFEARALDYLLKPVEPDRLARTVATLRERLAAPPALSDAALEALAAALRPTPQPTTLPVKAGDQYLFVPLREITHFEAKDKYVYAHTGGGKAHLVDQSLTRLLERLPPEFVQIHRGLVVNQPWIAAVYKLLGNRYQVHLRTRPVVKLTSGPSFAETIQQTLTF